MHDRHLLFATPVRPPLSSMGHLVQLLDLRDALQVAPLMVDATPRGDDNNLAYRLACLREQAATASAQALRVRPTARSVAWSPVGCSPAGGCLLALATEDGKVPRGLIHRALAVLLFCAAANFVALLGIKFLPLRAVSPHRGTGEKSA